MGQDLRSRDQSEQQRRLTSWLVAGLLAGVALIGLLAIFMVVVIHFEPPDWVQVVLGVGLVLGACSFAWLLASALTSSEATRARARRAAARARRADDGPELGSYSEVS